MSKRVFTTVIMSSILIPPDNRHVVMLPHQNGYISDETISDDEALAIAGLQFLQVVETDDNFAAVPVNVATLDWSDRNLVARFLREAAENGTLVEFVGDNPPALNEVLSGLPYEMMRGLVAKHVDVENILSAHPDPVPPITNWAVANSATLKSTVPVDPKPSAVAPSVPVVPSASAKQPANDKPKSKRGASAKSNVPAAAEISPETVQTDGGDGSGGEGTKDGPEDDKSQSPAAVELVSDTYELPSSVDGDGKSEEGEADDDPSAADASKQQGGEA